MKTTRALIALSVLMGLSYWGKEGFATESKKATVHPLYVSLIQLVANPTEYEGKSVKVRGYYRERHEYNAIYLSKDDADYGITMNSISCNFLEDELSRTLESELKPKLRDRARSDEKLIIDSKFVVVEGIFSVRHHESSGNECPAEIKMRKIIQIPPGSY